VERDPGLDAARAYAMILVVATHAALSFMATPIGWAVQDRSHHLGVDLYVWVVRAFAMPIFFWLSGYFSRAVLQGGVGAFVRHRVTRILLPLVLALIPVSLALSALWDWGRDVSTRALVADNIPKLQRSELPIVLGHLWYLYYLLWLSAAALLASRLRVRAPRGIAVIAIPAVIGIGALLWIGALQTDTPLGFIPDLPILVYMGSCFLWGWFVHARPEQLERYARHAWHALSVAPLFLAVAAITLRTAFDVFGAQFGIALGAITLVGPLVAARSLTARSLIMASVAMPVTLIGAVAMRGPLGAT